MSDLFDTTDVSSEDNDYLEDYFYEDNLVEAEIGIKCNACFGYGVDRNGEADCMICDGYGQVYVND